jgi:hypothetical protein
MSERAQAQERQQGALRRFELFPWDATFSANQESFELFTLTVRHSLRDDLEALISEHQRLPFATVNKLLVIIGFGAVREGARAFASLTGESWGPGRTEQIGFKEAMDAVTATSDPTAAEFLELRSTLEGLPEIDAVLSAAEGTLREKLVEQIPQLGAAQENLRHLLIVNLLHGVRLEHSYPRLMDRKRAEESLTERMLEGYAPVDDEELETSRRMIARFRRARSVMPWPQDLGCTCGAELAPQLVCCDADAPIDYATFEGDLAPDFLLHRECCGANLTGFTCARCGTTHTWTRGIVPGH